MRISKTSNPKVTKPRAAAAKHRWLSKPSPKLSGALVVAAVFGTVGIFTLMRSLAASPSLYLTPATSSVNVGDTVSVALRIDPGTTVDAVQATISYDPAVLSYVSTDATNSAFPVAIQLSSQLGSLQIARGAFAPTVVNTDSLVANITFKSLAAANPATLQLSGNATYGGNYINPAPTNATITISAPTPPPPSDTQAPAVTISSPKAGSSAVKSKFTIMAHATDNVTVSKIELYIDGAITQTTTASSINYTWSVKPRSIPKGAHTITVKATDTSGNVGSASVTVYK